MKDYLKEIKDRLEKATDGPWASLFYGLYAGSGKGQNVFDIHLFEGSEDNELSHDEVEANADLIAHAPSDLAKLVKVVELYEQVLKDECYCIESWNGVETCGLCEGVQKAKEIIHE